MWIILVFENESDLRSYKLMKLMGNDDKIKVKYLHIKNYLVSDINRSKVYMRKFDADRIVKSSSKNYLLRGKTLFVYRLKREEFESIIEYEKRLLTIEYERKISKLDVKKSKYKD